MLEMTHRFVDSSSDCLYLVLTNSSFLYHLRLTDCCIALTFDNLTLATNTYYSSILITDVM